MGKRSRLRNRDAAGAATKRATPYVARPFEGLAGEGDWVALRHFVPAATASLTLVDDKDRSITACSLLPGATPAMVRPNGDIWLGLQVQHAFGDAAREVADALGQALGAGRGRRGAAGRGRGAG